MVFALLFEAEYMRGFISSQLTCEIFVCANTWVSPGVITAISNTPVFAHPNQSVGTIVQLFGIVRTALPVPVTVLHIGHNTGLRQAGVRLFDYPLILSISH